MAIVVRYFSTAAAGAGDGTTWADRAQLVSGATWSTVITGFSFAGADSLECRIGPGTHSPTALFQASLFANPPSAANPLIMHGCDSSGNRLDPPDPDWTADRALFDDSGFPVIATTTNIITSNLANTFWRCIKATGSGAQGLILSFGNIDWCSIVNSTSNTSARGLSVSRTIATNSQVQMTGTSYEYGVSVSTSGYVQSVKVVGVAGSTGNRDGIVLANTNEVDVLDMCCVNAVGGVGIKVTSTDVAQSHFVTRCVVANCGGNGIKLASTASQTKLIRITGCIVTGNTTIGIDAQSAARLVVTNCRLRDNTTDLSGFGNYPTDFSNYTTDSDDATEYMDAASNDFQAKTGLAWGGMNIGISEQAAAGGGGSALHLGGLGQTGIGLF